MEKSSATFETFVGIKHLAFSPLSNIMDNTIHLGERLRRNSIYSLRAAIYQIRDSNKELEDIKQHMVEVLEEIELKLLQGQYQRIILLQGDFFINLL